MSEIGIKINHGLTMTIKKKNDGGATLSFSDTELSEEDLSELLRYINRTDDKK